MLRRILVLALLGAMLLPLGCMTTRPVMWSWPHHKRRISLILEGFHKLHMDIDRVIFDMDERPIEDLD